MTVSAYPVRVDASLDPQISRWLWLVKWILAIPHYFLLSFLWIAFLVVSVIAFFPIAFTGRYPASLFEFNLGVLRWSWRVQYYTFGALGTDRYPPFTLAEVPDYPAHLDITYPQRLSRGLVWVKWWLLAIPHYVIVGIFVGGGTWAVWQAPGGLLGILVLVAAVILLFTGRYPQQIFDFVLGIDRWVLRVAAYAALMTDQYPPFRLDMGAHEPGGTLTLRSPETSLPWGPPASATPPPRSGRRGWTGGRITALVVGCVLMLISLGVLAGGTAATWADNTQRDPAGYLTTGTHSFATTSYALTSGKIDLGGSGGPFALSGVLGTVRLRVTPVEPNSSVFVGLAPTSAVKEYLVGVRHEQLANWPEATTTREIPGGGPAAAPTSEAFWTARVSGSGTQTLSWQPSGGSWTVVVMNPDAASGVRVAADISATAPDLGWIAAGLLAAGALLLIGGVALVVAPAKRASR